MSDEDDLHEAYGAMIHRGKVEAGMSDVEWIKKELFEARSERDALRAALQDVREVLAGYDCEWAVERIDAALGGGNE